MYRNHTAGNWRACFSFFLMIAMTMAPIVARATEADVEWENILRLNAAMHQSDASAANGAERMRVDYREAGWRYFNKYPADARRWDWLMETLIFSPRYLRAGLGDEAGVAEVDEKAKDAWEKRYYSVLKPALLSSSLVSNELRILICAQELSWVFDEHAFAPQRRGEIVDVNLLLQAVVGFANQFPAEEATVIRYAGTIIYNADIWRLDQSTRETCVAAMKASSNKNLQQLADNWARLMRIQKQPSNLKLTAMDGRIIELSRLRGKVVLLDFWSTWCSSCIEAMPHIKEVYGRYHDRGFEVIGICFNDEKERPKVEALMKKMGIPWPQSLQPGGMQNPLAVEYSITAVPVTFLLDQQGILVTTDVRGPKLEKEIRKLLGFSPESGSGPELSGVR